MINDDKPHYKNQKANNEIHLSSNHHQFFNSLNINLSSSSLTELSVTEVSLSSDISEDQLAPISVPFSINLLNSLSAPMLIYTSFLIPILLTLLRLIFFFVGLLDISDNCELWGLR